MKTLAHNDSRLLLLSHLRESRLRLIAKGEVIRMACRLDQRLGRGARKISKDWERELEKIAKCIVFLREFETCLCEKLGISPGQVEQLQLHVSSRS